MDTPNWHNGYHYCSSEVPPESGTKYCSSEGWTCAGYEWHGWCQHGEIHYGAGADFNYPEDNCCACGKECSGSSDSLFATIAVNNVSDNAAETAPLTASSSTEACPGCQQCASENAWCSESLPCCDADARCESLLGGSGAQCVKQSQGDTPNWHNGFHYCSSEVPPESGTKYCSSEGWTCAGYEWHGWCQHGEIHYGAGAQFNYPEDNCCACGKECSGSSESLAATIAANNVSNSSKDVVILP